MKYVGEGYEVKYMTGNEQFGSPTKTVTVRARTAKDAVYQVKVEARSLWGASPWFQFKAVSVRPVEIDEGEIRPPLEQG